MKKNHRSAERTLSAVTKLLLWTAAILCSTSAHSLTFPIPTDGNVVGQVQRATIRSGEDLSTLGRRFNIGGYEMTEANPGVDYLHPKRGTTVIIPSKFVLPSAPRKGIVINLAEMRMYFYHPDGKHVSTYPIGVGMEGWDTPIGQTTVVRMRKNPTWVVPNSILENHRRMGKSIQPVMPPGPKNPLGKYAITTGFNNIVIHGTPYPRGVGVRSSHGCIRMLPEDIQALYQMVSIGTPITVVHEPYKMGYLGKQLYFESHVPLSASSSYGNTRNMDTMVQKLSQKIGKNVTIQWSEANRVLSQASGYPQPIGKVF